MASLIVAIGAQNAYVLRTGLTRRHVGLVVAVCAVSDALLVVAGVLGVGRLVTAHPAVLTWVRWVGAAYLIGFGITCLWRARRPSTLEARRPGGGPRQRARDRPRPHLAQPARLPRHRAARRVARQPARADAAAGGSRPARPSRASRGSPVSATARGCSHPSSRDPSRGACSTSSSGSSCSRSPRCSCSAEVPQPATSGAGRRREYGVLPDVAAYLSRRLWRGQQKARAEESP